MSDNYSNHESNDPISEFASSSYSENDKKFNEAVAFINFEFIPHWVDCVDAFYDDAGKFLKMKGFWDEVFNTDVNDRLNALHYHTSEKIEIDLTWVPENTNIKFSPGLSEEVLSHNKHILATCRKILNMEIPKGMFCFKIYKLDDESVVDTKGIPSIAELIKQFGL